MRIISGSARGRTLATPKNQDVRPTTDRIRESLFSILGDVRDAIVLDGFAGTGALGCEALSRGAQHCYFFDNARDSIALVRENTSRIKATDRATIINLPFARALSTIDAQPDLIFLDPPYSTALAQQALDALAQWPNLPPDALIVLEQETDDPQGHLPSPRFHLEDQRIYGRTRLSFFRHLAQHDTDPLSVEP